jgi:hypothetical protein
MYFCIINFKTMQYFQLYNLDKCKIIIISAAAWHVKSLNFAFALHFSFITGDIINRILMGKGKKTIVVKFLVTGYNTSFYVYFSFT